MAALVFLACVGIIFGHAHGALKLASYYSDHMVLQRGPQQAVLWGNADTEGDTVTAQVIGQGSAATSKVQNGKWKLKLPAITNPGPFTVDVKSRDGHVTLHDVLFGDVWLCSGQSNMEFEMKKVMNTSTEIQKGVTLKTIRYMKTQWAKSNTPVEDLQIGQPWTVPTEATLKEFSAVCYLYAEYLQSHLNYPIGLIGSYWGGTPIEAWSPPEAIRSCPVVTHGTEPDCCPHAPQILWNAKIYALRAMTIYGAVWYQGETNADHTTEYNCQQKAMIREWRAQFNRESMGQTRADFPFGYVQLGAIDDKGYVGGFPALRWSQTANHGYSPNSDQHNVFMAVAMDLPDFTSPHGAIHPRYKQEVAQRLVMSALNVAYGHKGVKFQGPFPTKILTSSSGNSLTIEFDAGSAQLDIRNTHGFEICCSGGCNMFNNAVAAPITAHSQSSVTVDSSGCGSQHVQVVRYAWRTSPCHLLQCAVYDSITGLPAPTFYLTVPEGGGLIG
ncbi:sialate O-acetylesterase-like isoform X2 [Littorina saxatilis]|uniref:Sialate O-acetylesterase domain-containing protein n=1 Tax=Littorina saxatilis TaxID=31220 RepID=A0AAN9BMH2_9CAEN